MRIAFVGKGGSGKTTLAALYTQYLRNIKKLNIVAIDADINLHLSEYLGIKDFNLKHLSNPSHRERIKTFLSKDNNYEFGIAEMVKTTPPTTKSNIIDWCDFSKTPLAEYAVSIDNCDFFTVGTYTAESIGIQCHHGANAVLENILSHSLDNDRVIVSDMVAGTDSFSNTMHFMFDLLVYVFNDSDLSQDTMQEFIKLAKVAGIEDNILFIKNQNVPLDIEAEDNTLTLPYTQYLKDWDRTDDEFDIRKVSKKVISLLDEIYDEMQKHKMDPDERYNKLLKAHNMYIKQSFVTERFGDLNRQVASEFSFKKIDTYKSDPSVFYTQIYKSTKGYIRHQQVQGDLFDTLEMLKPSSVLEIGAGNGHLLIELAGKFPNTSFLLTDFSDEMVNEARSLIKKAKLSNVEVQKSNFEDLVKSKNTYDLVVCHTVLEWLDDDIETNLRGLINFAQSNESYVSLLTGNIYGFIINYLSACDLESSKKLLLKPQNRVKSTANLTSRGLFSPNPLKIKEVLDEYEADITIQRGVRVLFDKLPKEYSMNLPPEKFDEVLNLESLVREDPLFMYSGNMMHTVFRVKKI